LEEIVSGETSVRPFEPPDGQDDSPDERQALRVAVRLVRDLRDGLKMRELNDEDREDLHLRADAFLNVGDRIFKET
jgi:hypothetical protein